MSSDPDSSELLTVAQVAGEMQVAKGTVRNWINSNELTASKIGKFFRIRRSALDAMLEQHRYINTDDNHADGAGGVWDRGDTNGD